MGGLKRLTMLIEPIMNKHEGKVSIILVLSFLFLLSLSIIRFSTILFEFPLGAFVPDSSTNIARVQFWIQYGPFGTAPNWYGGYSNFFSFPPLYLTAAYPFALLLGASAGYVLSALVLIGVSSAAALLIAGKMNMPKRDALLVLAAVWGNMFSINSFLLGGRIGELAGTATGVAFTFYALYLFGKKDVTWKNSAVLGVLFAFIGYGYFLLLPLYGTLILGLLLAKREARLKIAACAIAALLLVTPLLVGVYELRSKSIPLASEPVGNQAGSILFYFMASLAVLIAAAPHLRKHRFLFAWALLLAAHVVNLFSGVFAKVLPLAYVSFLYARTVPYTVFFVTTGIAILSYLAFVQKEGRTAFFVLLTVILTLGIALLAGREVKYASTGGYFFNTGNLENFQEIDGLQKIISENGGSYLALGTVQDDRTVERNYQMHEGWYAYASFKHNLTTPLGGMAEAMPAGTGSKFDKIASAFPCGTGIYSFTSHVAGCSQQMDCEKLRDGIIEIGVSWIIASKNLQIYMNGCGYAETAGGQYALLYRR